MHGIERFEDVKLFRNGSVHEFYCLKALIISLKQVITPVVGEKKNYLNEQNFYGEAISLYANESWDEHFRRQF